MNNSLISYTEAAEGDHEAWLALASKLWPDTTPPELQEEFMHLLLSSDEHAFFAKCPEQGTIGFVAVAIRHDYVEGATTSPAGYLEGIYVEEAFRRAGVGRQLLALGEKRLFDKGCRQIGSDTWLDNQQSQAFHKRSGFREEAVLVHYLKEIIRD